jgi:hypothetical protein
MTYSAPIKCPLFSNPLTIIIAIYNVIIYTITEQRQKGHSKKYKKVNLTMHVWVVPHFHATLKNQNVFPRKWLQACTITLKLWDINYGQQVVKDNAAE